MVCWDLCETHLFLLHGLLRLIPDPQLACPFSPEASGVPQANSPTARSFQVVLSVDGSRTLFSLSYELKCWIKVEGMCFLLRLAWCSLRVRSRAAAPPHREELAEVVYMLLGLDWEGLGIHLGILPEKLEEVSGRGVSARILKFEAALC